MRADGVEMRPGGHMVPGPQPKVEDPRGVGPRTSPEKSQISKYKLVTGPESTWPGQDVHGRYPGPEEPPTENTEEEIRES